MDLLLTGMLMSPVALVVILIIALLIFGKRLPEVARSLGKGITEFKKGVKGVEEEIDRPLPPPAPPNQIYGGYSLPGQQQYPQNQYAPPGGYQPPYQGQQAPAQGTNPSPGSSSGQPPAYSEPKSD